jgi:hypothetical protein
MGDREAATDLGLRLVGAVSRPFGCVSGVIVLNLVAGSSHSRVEFCGCSDPCSASRAFSTSRNIAPRASPRATAWLRCSILSDLFDVFEARLNALHEFGRSF